MAYTHIFIVAYTIREKKREKKKIKQFGMDFRIAIHLASRKIIELEIVKIAVTK